jgi:hypothetical protein
MLCGRHLVSAPWSMFLSTACVLQVSDWARWHQTQPSVVQDPKTFQQLNRRTSLDAVSRPTEQEEVIVGLEEWPAPEDFYVRSGTYNGLRVCS